MLQDVRFAVRMLAGMPAMTPAAVLPGVWALAPNATILSPVASRFLRPLAVRDASRIIHVIDSRLWPPSVASQRGLGFVHREIRQPVGFAVVLAPHVLECDASDLRRQQFRARIERLEPRVSDAVLAAHLFHEEL